MGVKARFSAHCPAISIVSALLPPAEKRSPNISVNIPASALSLVLSRGCSIPFLKTEELEDMSTLCSRRPDGVCVCEFNASQPSLSSKTWNLLSPTVPSTDQGPIRSSEIMVEVNS